MTAKKTLLPLAVIFFGHSLMLTVAWSAIVATALASVWVYLTVKIMFEKE